MPGLIRGLFFIPVRVYIHACDPPLCSDSMGNFEKKTTTAIVVVLPTQQARGLPRAMLCPDDSLP
jgi:hypothetical protein